MTKRNDVGDSGVTQEVRTRGGRAFPQREMGAHDARVRRPSMCLGAHVTLSLVVGGAKKRSRPTKSPKLRRVLFTSPPPPLFPLCCRCPSRATPLTAHVAQWSRAGSHNTNHYGVGEGPAAHLLRIIRDAPETPNVTQVYEAAVAKGEVGVHSRTHMKKLLNWMRKINRITSVPPKRGPSGLMVRGSFVFALTKQGAEHIAKIDAAMENNELGRVKR